MERGEVLDWPGLGQVGDKEGVKGGGKGHCGKEEE